MAVNNDNNNLSNGTEERSGSSNRIGPTTSRPLLRRLQPDEEETSEVLSQANPMESCSWCDRAFPTKRGLGQHIKRAHHVEANDAINVDRIILRWSLEEINMMAQAEAIASSQNIRFINIHLHDLFPQRTIEAIKGKRRELEYKRIVSSMLAVSHRRSTILANRRS